MCWISLSYVELHTNYVGIHITPKRVDKTLHEFCSIVGAVFARGVVTRVAPEMKDHDTRTTFSYSWIAHQLHSGPILIPIPVFESPAQTTPLNVLDFFCKT